MNREIEFRAIEKDTNKWRYGDLIQDFSVKHNYYIGDNDCNEVGDVYYQSFAVIPETLGQYTGLKDKNGKKVFEGDIVRDISNNEIYQVKYYHGAFTLFENIGNQNIYRYYLGDYDIAYLEILGNIYENKDLLEENKYYE